MNKKIIYGIIIVAIVIIGLSMLLLKSSLNLGGDPFGAPPSGDPFGAPPIGISDNCGPEDRYKFNVTLNSKEDFVNLVKTQEINQWVRLDNFKDEPSGEINWNKALNSVNAEQIGSRTIYSIEYTPSDCSPVQKFTLKVTNDGHVSVYGCCGK